MFATLLRDQGPMDPNDTVIQHELEMCSTEAQVIICEAGGISKFLRQSLQFAIVDGFVCLTSDAPKARQLARSRRQQQPPIKLNPPQYMVAQPAGMPPAFIPTATSSAPFVARMHPHSKSHRSLAGVDISSSSSLPSRVVPASSQQSDFPPPTVSAFLSQPSSAQHDINPSVDLHTAVRHPNTTNDNGIRSINANNTYDNWTTVTKVSKSSGGVRNSGSIVSSNAIGDLDDFLEPCTTGKHSSIDELTLNSAAAIDVTKQNINYEHFKNMHKMLESDSSDESSDDDDSLSDSECADWEDVRGDDAAVADVYSLVTETAETSAASVSVTLSANAPEFVPLSMYAVNQPSLIADVVGKSGPKTTASNGVPSDGRPSSRASAVMTDKQVQTAESWSAAELQQLKDSHGQELGQLRQELSHCQTQLQVCLPALFSYSFCTVAHPPVLR